MGTSKDLKTLLREGLEAEERRDTDEFRQVVAMLRDAADVFREFLQKGAPDADVSVDVVSGYPVNAGVEQRVVVRVPSHGVSDYLLRAYVPLDGYPVVIDTVDDEDTEYRTQQQLQGALAKLVRKPWFRERLSALREVIRDPQMRTERPKSRSVSSRPKRSSSR